MKLKKVAIYLAVASLTAGFASCNDKSVENETILAGSAMVSEFSLRESKALPGIDSVFFTIDQKGMRIYNADSLPLGTRVNALVPSVTTRGASSVEFIVSRPGRPDTIYNYLEENMDSIDFSSENEIKLRIVSIEGQATSLYKVSLNVHKVKGDTLVWRRLDRSTLPSRFQMINEQHSAATADQYYCLTRYQSDYCMARATNPGGTWVYATPQFDFDPDLDSFNATADKLYILDRQGKLYESADNGVTWTATGRTWSYIYGGYGKRLIGSSNATGRWRHVEYPAATESDIPAGFPVRNTSQSVCRSFEMSSSQQMIVVGGRFADGSLSADSWGFDGKTWAKIGRTPVAPRALENMVLVPYFTVRTDSASWVTTSRSVLMAMMGNTADNKLNDTIYVSYDFGMNWTKADKLMQHGNALPARTMAQGFVYNERIYADQSQNKTAVTPLGRGWKTIGQPSWTQVRLADENLYGPVFTGEMVYATKPIDEWDCPYIYLFGGKDSSGQTYNTLFRGVIEWFRFRPLQ